MSELQITDITDEKTIKSNEYFGSLQTSLAKLIIQILDILKITWYLNNETLLGVYRNNKMIPQRNNFNIAIFIPYSSNDSKISEIYSHMIKLELEKNVTNSHDVHVNHNVNGKIEIYNSSYGTFSRNNKILYNVATILTLHTFSTDRKYIAQCRNDCQDRIDYINLFPLQTIKYEGCDWNIPHKSKEFLENIYGYIGPNYLYNNIKKKYEQNLSAVPIIHLEKQTNKYFKWKPYVSCKVNLKKFPVVHLLCNHLYIPQSIYETSKLMLTKINKLLFQTITDKCYSNMFVVVHENYLIGIFDRELETSEYMLLYEKLKYSSRYSDSAIGFIEFKDDLEYHSEYYPNFIKYNDDNDISSKRLYIEKVQFVY